MSLQLPVTKSIDWSALSDALKRAVPAFGWLTGGALVMTLTRETGEFSDAELASIQAVIAGHDAAAIAAARAARASAQAAARAQNPSTLTLPDRVARVELLLNLDEGDLHGTV